jgi:hypothetical protein
MPKKVILPSNLNFLKESDFDFIDDEIKAPLDGVRFTMNRPQIKGDDSNTIYYIVDDGGLFVKIKWFGGGSLTRTFSRKRVMDLFKRGVWVPYLDSIKESDFDFIKDHDSLDGVIFTIPPERPETIYKIKDDSLDHRVIVTWDDSELIDDRDSNYSEINQKLKFNLTNSDVERLFQFYFDTDEWDSPLSEKRERVQDYMINNFEDDELLYYMGDRKSLETAYNRDVVKRYLKNGDWVIYDEKINESSDWDWVSDVPGTKEFGQKYRYFEIVACYGVDYEYEECDDEYSHFVKIPKYEVDEIWDIPDDNFDYLAGPGDEGEGVIMYAIKNQLISHFDINEILMFQGVRELNKNTYDKLTNYRDDTMVESNDLGWIEDTNPKEIENLYVYVLDYFDWSKKYKEYSYSTNMIGEVEWYSSINDKYYYYATPYWEGNGVMKIDAVDEVGNDIEVHTIPLPKFKYEEQLKEWLQLEYPKIVYKEIKIFENTHQDENDLNESDDLQWIKDVGIGRIDMIQKIKEKLANRDVEVEWEKEHLGYHQEETNGTRGEVFAKFFYDTGDGEFFIELIESENGLYGFYVYEYDEKYDTYYVNVNYSSLGTPRESDEFWRHVCWTVLNQMGAFPKKDKSGDLGDYLKESEDFDWIEDVTPRMDATLLKPGQKFYDKWGDVIRVLEYLGRDDDEGEVCYKPPCSLLRFRKIKDPSGYRMIPGLPADDPQNTDMIMIPSDFDKHIESGKLKLVSKRTMYESKDFDWVGDVKLGSIDKNKNYVLDVSSLDLSDVEVHPRSSVSKREALLDEILENLSELGYDTDTVRSELSRGLRIYYLYLTKYKNNGRLVIEYDDHDVDDPTYGGEYEIVHSVKDFIFMIKNKMVKESNDFDWVRDVEPQIRFSDVELGKKYSIDFIQHSEVLKHLRGCGITQPREKMMHTEYVIPESLAYLTSSSIYCGGIDQKEFEGQLPSLELSFYDKNGVGLFSFFWFAEDGTIHLKPHTSKLQESKDLDWIRGIEPKGFEKSKSYVVDVSDLKPYTPMYTSPTSEEYTKLTRADVLDKFKELGYNIDEISVPDADYLYIEPNDKAGYWDDVVWVKQTHWLDYDMKHNTLDPTYGGKYEMIDVNDLMFLLDNKFISESKTITEVAGISFESREWAKIINDEILKNPNEKERLIIDGYNYPEAFKSFPIDYIVIDFYDKLTGYGQEHSGYDKDGNYVVLLYIQPKVISGMGGFNLRTVLNHEMKHAWDDYNRLSKGQPSIDKNKENRELYNKDFILMLSDKNVHGPIKELLKYYYYLSELEKTAYLENVYDGNLNYEKIIRDISSKDFEPFKERFDLDINWHLMNTAYDIPFLKKFKSPIEFIDYSSEELRSKSIDMIKKINKMKYVHGIG